MASNEITVKIDGLAAIKSIDGVIRHTSIAEKSLAHAMADLEKMRARIAAGEIIPVDELHGIVTGLADAQRLVAALSGGQV